jgi:hypothetical protein
MSDAGSFEERKYADEIARRAAEREHDRIIEHGNRLNESATRDAQGAIRRSLRLGAQPCVPSGLIFGDQRAGDMIAAAGTLLDRIASLCQPGSKAIVPALLRGRITTGGGGLCRMWGVSRAHS